MKTNTVILSCVGQPYSIKAVLMTRISLCNTSDKVDAVPQTRVKVKVASQAHLNAVLNT